MTASLLAIRYTAAELLAYTICKLFPGSRLLSGSVNELGFYYDFIIPYPIDPQFTLLIEEAMRGNIKENFPILEKEMMRENAADFFAHRNQPYKAELIAASSYNIVKLIEFDHFFDVAPLCITQSTNEIEAFKIIGFEPIEYLMLSEGKFPAIRFFGNAFQDKQSLKRFVKLLKVEKENDHRILARSMEIFIQQDSLSSLEGTWLPKGTAMCEILLNLWREESLKRNVRLVNTPQFIKENVLKKNELTKENYLFLETNTGDTYSPASSPSIAHSLLFKEKSRAFTEMPIHFGEIKKIFNNQDAQVPSAGMLITGTYTADFTHSFCAPEQLYAELISSLQFIAKIVTILGFRCQWNLSSQGTKYVGTKKQWEHALALMRQALEASGLSFTEEASLEILAGPKIEAKILDVAERGWPGPELTIDFDLPVKLGLQYSKKDSVLGTPILLKQTILGSLERLVALLIEKDGGALPLWLAPEQVRIITVDDSSHGFAKEVLHVLLQAHVRAACDLTSRPLGTRVHDVECTKVPYALIIGDKEEKEKVVNVRKCGHRSTSQRISLKAFLHELQKDPAFTIPTMAK